MVFKSYPKPEKRAPKKRKAIKKSRKSKEEIAAEKAEQQRMWAVFLEFYDGHPAKCCEECAAGGVETKITFPRSYHFDHVLPKASKHFGALVRHDKRGLQLLCGDCHSRKTAGILTPFQIIKREQTIALFSKLYPNVYFG